MPLTAFELDRANAAMTVTYEVDVPAERAWQLWADPRQLERWWGPPTWPASVGRHELAPGGVVTYVMTGPDGEQAAGWWRIVDVRAPRMLVVDDAFGTPEEPSTDFPVSRMTLDITDRTNGCTMRLTSVLPSQDAFDQLIDMGVEEGMRSAMAQIESVLTG